MQEHPRRWLTARQGGIWRSRLCEARSSQAGLHARHPGGLNVTVEPRLDVLHALHGTDGVQDPIVIAVSDRAVQDHRTA